MRSRQTSAFTLAVCLAAATTATAQEGNPCQAALTTVETNPNQLAFHIEDIDKLGVTTLEYVIFIKGNEEAQGHVKVPRPQLKDTGFMLCYTLPFAPPAHLTRDGKTQFIVVARTEDANMRVSAWSAPSNPFVLGTVTPPPAPLPLPVPGVRVGQSTP